MNFLINHLKNKIIWLTILLFFPPFFGGLFVTEDWLYYQSFVTLILVALTTCQPIEWTKTTLSFIDWALLALFICYISSAFVAVNVQWALIEALKYGSFLLIYHMIVRYSSSLKDVILLLQTFYFAG
ncbi:MAG: hypothetical protein M0T74_03080, partial [Desulfitobacterium hafniense]|nr:hypothetical protein [Desulfitobacterium hafniense]